MKTILAFDAPNILYRTFYAGWKLTDDKHTMSSMAIHSTLLTLNKYFNKYQPDKVICAFDKPNWRKQYTESDLCLSGKIYKGNRRQDMTPTEQMCYEEYTQHIERFEQILTEYSSILVMSRKMLEADDILAGVAQHYSQDRVIAISSDRDLTQLLRFKNVKLIDPATGNPILCDDIDWFLFLKAIRGDRGDNLPSAYPRVKETRVRKAYEDELERLNLMNEVWTDENKVEKNVGELFEENKLLMDLYGQPDLVKQLIAKAIEDGEKNQGKYSHFHFLKFCNKHDLVKIRDNAGDFVKLLSSR
jgi:hypothetical protein